MSLSRWRSRLLASVGALTVVLSFAPAGAVSSPRAVQVPNDPLSAVVTAKSWAAWRVNLPVTGFVDFSFLGANTGSGSVAFADNGGGGGGYPVVQAGSNGKGIHEGAAAEVGDIGVLVPPGLHWFVAIVGGGTVPAGADLVRITAPAGTSVSGFSSGVAIDLTDENFTAPHGTSIDSPLVVKESINGTVRKTFKHGLFGLFFTEGPAHISYVDPAGTSHTGDSGVFSWFNAGPGAYAFQASATAPLGPETTTGAHVRAILADIALP